jgi:glycosyltransferase involved in cell wall biosynthesis
MNFLQFLVRNVASRKTISATLPVNRLRQLAKGVLWLWTSLRLLRGRVLARSYRTELDKIEQHQRVCAQASIRGETVTPPATIDLCDDAAVAAWMGQPAQTIFWPPVDPAHIVDRRSAARYCIDAWRRRPEARRRFPRAFSQQSESFADFLCMQESVAEIVTEQAAQQIRAVLQRGYSERVRQYFLASCPLRAVAPETLTPSGHAQALRWFLRHGTKHTGLTPEEIWWLFLQALQDPRRELILAYSFTPAWQRKHPAALTAFGWPSFASWFAGQYGVAPADWLSADPVLTSENADAQIRAAYWASSAWRERHPRGLATQADARALLDWLASPQGPLTTGLRAQVYALDLDALAQKLARPGVNVIGHFCYPSGLRVSVQSMVRGLDAADVQTMLRDVRTKPMDEPRHADFSGLECHDITLIHVQPRPLFDRAYELADLAERQPRTYRIAYWYWEFDEIPAAWLKQARHVDEVWAATEFVAGALRARLSVPVHTLFPGVEIVSFESRNKRYFGLKDEHFTFLFAFHMMSVMERKNPLGLIRAFKQAFQPNEPVQLVLKISAGTHYPLCLEQLRRATVGANIKIIDEFYSPGDILALMECCDAYVSLHRSEGLGLTMAEAMLLGKPVIATNYSGNLDFMDNDNSLLVPCKITTLKRAIPPYGAGLRWAQPSEEHAVRFMRRLYENPAWARELGARAQASARRGMSIEVAGARMRERIEKIRATMQEKHEYDPHKPKFKTAHAAKELCNISL